MAYFQRCAYCDVDLTPTWDYDLEKAELLNCPDDSTNTDDAVKGSGTDNTGIIVFLIILVVLAFIGMACMAKKERDGRPLFTPLIAVEDKKNTELARV